MDKFFAKVGLSISLVFLGLALGAGITYAFLSGAIGERDSKLREYSELRRELAEYRERVESQAGLVDERLQALGGGLREIKDIAGRATTQSGDLVRTLRESAKNLQSISIGVTAMENDFNRLRIEYDNLLNSIRSGETSNN